MNTIEMPKLSDTMTVGTLVKWLKKEGDTVKNGDMLAEVETDKATMELECFFDGTLLKIFTPAGSQVPVGAPLCAVGKPGEKVEVPAGAPPAAAAPADKPAAKAPAAAPASAPAAPAASSQPAPAPAAKPAAPAPAPVAAPSERLRISPLARKLAAEKGINPAGLSGSGPSGRIVRADVAAAEKTGGSKASTVAPGGTGAIQEESVAAVSNMRATIARRLLESKTQIPHFYLDIEIDAEPLLSLRAQLNRGLESEGVKLSVNDFILKASAEALRRVPAMNCSWEETPGAPNPSIRRHAAAHVSFAVAIEDGLITPVVRDANAKTIFAISSEAKSLGEQARNRKLQPAQFTGGTFCVSNMGMKGVEHFYAIINPPNAGILAVGAVVKKPVVKNDQLVVGQRLALALSCDHRAVNGADGADFLVALRDLLESPALLLL